jgi:thiamine biosynthesis protein ThiS
MKKIKKIKIKINGKVKIIEENLKIQKLITNLKIPIKKVAIELNYEILDKKKLNNVKLKKNDRIEIVHFIGGG